MASKKNLVREMDKMKIRRFMKAQRRKLEEKERLEKSQEVEKQIKIKSNLKKLHHYVKRQGAASVAWVETSSAGALP